MDGNFTFPCSGVRHHVHINHACDMVDVHTDRTYGPPDTHHLRPHNFNIFSFWKSISRLEDYNPSTSLVSNILSHSDAHVQTNLQCYFFSIWNHQSRPCRARNPLVHDHPWSLPSSRISDSSKTHKNILSSEEQDYMWRLSHFYRLSPCTFLTTYLMSVSLLGTLNNKIN